MPEKIPIEIEKIGQQLKSDWYSFPTRTRLRHNLEQTFGIQIPRAIIPRKSYGVIFSGFNSEALQEYVSRLFFRTSSVILREMRPARVGSLVSFSMGLNITNRLEKIYKMPLQEEAFDGFLDTLDNDERNQHDLGTLKVMHPDSLAKYIQEHHPVIKLYGQ